MRANAYIVHRAMCEPELEWRKPKDCLLVEPLYTAPPRKPWVGLTDEEQTTIVKFARHYGDAMHMTEAKLKEKNA
jgi:hypothetical protein